MSWTHLSDVHPTSRKPYTCYLCERPIPAGEKHVKRTGIGDGGFDTFRMHARCEEKTKDWGWWEWEESQDEESQDAASFREYELGEDSGRTDDFSDIYKAIPRTDQ